MVCEYGMSDALGPLAYGSEEGSVFLGKDYNSRQQDYSEQTAREIDQEVRRIIQVQYDAVRQLLADKKDRVEAIAKALMELETLDATELKAIFDGEEIPRKERYAVASTYAEKDKKEKDKRRVASIFGGTPKPVVG